jgi:hypothetical protein
VLRKLTAGVALWALLAGCAGPSGPSTAERSICRAVRAQLDALPKQRPLPDYAVSESKRLLGGATSQSTIVFFRTSFVHELTRSGDPTFERLGEVLQRGTGVASAIGQLDARCSAIRL